MLIYKVTKKNDRPLKIFADFSFFVMLNSENENMQLIFLNLCFQILRKVQFFVNCF